jgi:protein farnesyltransferase/geranylgeranyltransferase type-1 subunit alpha
MVLGSLQTPSRSEWTPPGSSIDVIQRFFSDIPSAPQPNVKPIPVVQISYSKEFAYIMGVYLSMLRSLTSGSVSPDAALSSTAGDFSTQRIAVVQRPTARWLMLLGIVLTKCPSHYTAWKQRRDVIMNHNHMYELCCSEIYDKQPHAIPMSEMIEAEAEAITFWTPNRSDIEVFPSVDTGNPASASVWRCVLWELLTTAQCFVRDFHKNFQLWHHRKELILLAIEHTPVEHLASVDAFNRYLQQQHQSSSSRPMTFSDFDERIVCDVVLLDEDSKNYHVWSHRAWFLMSFPFIAVPLSLDAMKKSVLGDKGSDDSQAFSPMPLSDLKWSAGAAEILPSPSEFCNTSLFLEELHYTARRIGEDWFNNSAWCHRFAVFKKYVVTPLMAPAALGEDAAEVTRRILRNLCEAEVHYALRWAVVEPCNECPYVYAKGVADLWQVAMLGLLSSSDQPSASEGLLATAALQVQGISWAAFRGSQALHDEIVKIIDLSVLPVVAEIRAATAASQGSDGHAETEMNSATRAIFLRNNTHQPTAAIFRILFDRMESTWSTYLEPSQKESHLARYPIDSFEQRGESSDASEQASSDSIPWEAALRQWEMTLVQLGSQLHAADGIRAKYWRHMVHTVVHRQY